MDNQDCVGRKDHYNQVCVWPGCVVASESDDKGTPISDFENLMLEKFNTKVQYLEEVKTNPDRDDNGQPVPGTGDRNDLLFAVHDEDVIKFSLPRLQYGIRWVEDVMSEYNNSWCLYPSYVRNYCTW